MDVSLPYLIRNSVYMHTLEITPPSEFVPKARSLEVKRSERLQPRPVSVYLCLHFHLCFYSMMYDIQQIIALTPVIIF